MTDAESDPPEPTPSRWAHRWPWFALGAVILIADLATKEIVFSYEVGRDRLVTELFTGFRIVHAYNPGVTFGAFDSAGPHVLGALTAAVIVFLLVKLWLLPPTERLQSFAVAIISGGAIGNLYDRVIRTVPEGGESGVRDFLDWYIPRGTSLGDWLVETCGTNHWYTSNVADVFIVCGVILLAWCILTEKEPEPDAETENGRE